MVIFMAKSFLDLQRDFVNLRFGAYIHFNSATLAFSEGERVDWDIGIEDSDDPKRRVFDPADWDIPSLDIRGWAKAIKSAGMNFAALVTKHHEGFSLWPSEYTDHCVKNAPTKTDIVGEYVRIFREEGLAPGLDYSILDLHHNITRTNFPPGSKEYLLGQIKELLTNYGEIPFLLLDGWQAPWGGPSYAKLSFEEVKAVNSIQPNCLVLNHSSEVNLDHSDIVVFENNAGQNIPPDFVGPGSLAQKLTDAWFWREIDPTATLKTAEWALENKVYPAQKQNCVCMLNISPNPDGGVDDNLAQRFEEIGAIYRAPAPVTEIPKGWMTRP